MTSWKKTPLERDNDGILPQFLGSVAPFDFTGLTRYNITIFRILERKDYNQIRPNKLRKEHGQLGHFDDDILSLNSPIEFVERYLIIDE